MTDYPNPSNNIKSLPAGANTTRLQGLGLVIARAIWFAVTGITVALLVISSPALFQISRHLPSGYEGALVDLGLSAHSLTVYFVAMELVAMVAFFAVAVAIFWFRSDDWMAIFTSLMLVTFGAVITQSLGHLLAAAQPLVIWLVQFVFATGLSSLLVFIYIFPNGKFAPRWTLPASIIYAGWMAVSFFFPNSRLNPNFWSPVLGFVANMAWYLSGLFVTNYRQKHLFTPVELQQTKWVTFGLLAALLGFVVSSLVQMIPLSDQPDGSYLVYFLIGNSISLVLTIMVPLTIGLSILHYRLWEVDVIIHGTLVYGALTGTLGLLYLGSVFVLQRMFHVVIGRQSEAAVILSTLAIAALFRPWRQRLQNFIDRRFYREQVDFRRAFADFSREVRAIIDLPELLRVLVYRTTDLLHISHGAVFLRDQDGAFYLAESRNVTSAQVERLPQETRIFYLDRLHRGDVVSRSGDPACALLVPLLAPRIEMQRAPAPTKQPGQQLIGVLALGPRLSGQDYTRDDQELLRGLADQAGTAIHVARLIEEKQTEAQRKEEAERRLEAYRHSPTGRAEALAQQLVDQPDTALIEIYRLAQSALRDPNAASLLANLPQALAQKMGQEQDPNGLETWMVGLAEGFNYLFTSPVSPELLPVGLRTLVTVLPVLTLFPPVSDPEGAKEVRRGAPEALAIYRLCQEALDANSITQIIQLSDVRLRVADVFADQSPVGDLQSEFLVDLSHALSSLQLVIDALRACDLVDTTQDKLAYLASAIERLRQVDRQARAELGGIDRPVVRRIVESWLAVVASAMGELQTRAQLVCQLLTRHTWVGDVVLLALGLRNDGRGTALNLRVTLAPAPEYTALQDMAQIERLSPGEEAQAELRVHLRNASRLEQFRARFIIQYDDPRGPDQVENFADVVYLLAAEGEFQFIPNPYVVGTPLQPGSPLFFGRQDVIAFIQDNLSAAHRNNLVLIGQRRTGKTSLLKQLSARLGQDYLPVYLDGQSLALDPGLPNFFLALATEITFAVQDCGFEMQPPQSEDYASSSAANFERRFLLQVRQTIGGRHLLLLLDEFEELEASVRRGSLDDSVFAFLRHIIQHTPNLSVIFCGTHRLEELSADYWSVLFNISLYRPIAYLEKAEGMRLIQEPVQDYGMRYDDLALDKLWRVTAGHPYFLQLLCHSLVNRHNLSGRQAGKIQRNYITVADVNAALEDILASGEAHFVYLWSDSTAVEKLALTALSRMMPLTGQVGPAQVLDYLAERGVSIAPAPSGERQAVSEAMHHLALRDILQASTAADATLGETYRWQLGLLGLWVEKYKSLSRVVDEVER